MQYQDLIERVPDETGDKVKLSFFNTEDEKLNFNDFAFKGTILVDIDYSGKPRNVRYGQGATPRTWQAGKHFIQDIARFRFRFTNPKKRLFSFKVNYFWSVVSDSSLTSFNRKEKAIDYLRKQRK